MTIEERKAELLPKTIEEAVRWGARPIVVEFDIGTALAICGALQLALRHPEFKGAGAAAAAYQFVKTMESSIPESFPALRETIGLGFNREFDCDHAETPGGEFAA